MKNWKEMPEHTRVWVYQADRELTNEEQNIIIEKGSAFVNEWTAHGAKMDAGIEIFNNAFIVIFADEQSTKATGCSIDSSVHFIQEVGRNMNVDLFNRLIVAVERNGETQLHHSTKILELLQSGKLDMEDITFNNLVSTLGEFKANWKVPLKSSWVAQTL